MSEQDYSFSDIRREYGQLTLRRDRLLSDPVEQFIAWFEAILQTKAYDPTAMVLSTVDEHQCPDSRVVLLKGVEHGQYIFYTNYGSSKSEQLGLNNAATLLFFWPAFVRQVRIRGRVNRVSSAVSEAYFHSRPRSSQVSAYASPQSRVVASRQELEQRVSSVEQQYANQEIPCPSDWGGYAVVPFEYEFWQGRDDRLHDRFRYRRGVDNKWLIERLGP